MIANSIHRFCFKFDEKKTLDVEVSTSHVTASEVLEAFISYLKAVGYHEKSIQEAIDALSNPYDG